MKKGKLPLESKKITILFVFLIGGVLFLLLGEYISNSKSVEKDAFDDEAYTAKLEERLCRILEEMEGVDKVSVMITLEGTEEAQYVTESGAMGTSLLVSGGTGQKEPILKAKTLPKVRGVSVVCRGAGDDKLKAKIIHLVASTLNLNTNQIYVTE